MQTDTFEGLLLKGEKIVWWGQPAQGLLFTSKDWFLIPFSMMFLAFSVFWETMVIRAANAPIFMRLWGIPFMLVGLYLFVGRLVVDAWARRLTTYAVTDKRILIQRTAPFAKFTAMAFGQLPTVNLTENVGGRGTIRFGQDQPAWSNRSFAGWSPAFDPTPQFIAIEEARKVFDHIQTQLANRN